MVIEREVERKLNAFCKEGNLEEYRDILKDIFSKIYKEECRIAPRYDQGGRSIHEFQLENRDCLIRIPLKFYIGKPVEAVWTILHEFGHHLSGEGERSNKKPEYILKREELAWDLAREQLLNYPVLAVDIAGFDQYAQKCLESYYKEFGLQKAN